MWRNRTTKPLKRLKSCEILLHRNCQFYKSIATFVRGRTSVPITIMTYIEELNPSQIEAVVNFEGPSMVIAGAGSGKTRVLTFRIAYMMENGVDPFEIMALTFTNKAAREMKERIGHIVGDGSSKSITMGTFHSVFSKILRYNSDRLGYPSNFTIYDSQDSRSLIKTVIKELNLDDKVYKPAGVQARISGAKNNLISADAYAVNPDIQEEDRLSRRPQLGNIYKTYVERCFKAGAMDFDDLLYQTNVLLRDHPDVLHYYQHKFRYILVDEYQDTNYAQYLIVKKLAAVYENICVVGDDAQSIYSFRGANIQNILNFKKDYPEFRLFKLEQNYRSTRNIVEAANSVIKRNVDQIEKKVWTSNNEGKHLSIYRAMSDNDEAKIVVNLLHDLHKQESCGYNDFAILYRTNKQSRSFEESLRKLNIPYKIFGGLSFYQRKEIKDLLAYFRLVVNPNDEEALKRIINYPKRGIGDTSLDHLIVAAGEYKVPIWEIISNMAEYNLPLNGTTRNRIQEFATMIQSFAAESQKLNAHELAQRIVKASGIYKELKAGQDRGIEEVERFQNMEQLMSGIQEFTLSNHETGNIFLSDFLMDVALLTDADEQTDEKNYVSLMTIHSSKGLEFKHVFLVGLEENLFPSQMSTGSREELEEERRLFYVAVTRAMETCTLSFATSRFVFGQITFSEPSRFLDEIDKKYIKHEYVQREGTRSLNANRFENLNAGGMGLNRRMPNLKPLKSVSTSANGGGLMGKKPGETDGLKVGDTVRHDRFGKGKVTSLEGSGLDQKATIFFPEKGAKTLVIRFARLEILES